MDTNILERRMQKAAALAASAGLLLVFGLAEVEAASKPLSCSISPSGASTAVGVPVIFSGMTQGGKGQKSYSWDFSDGSGIPATSTDNNVDVTYSTAGGPFSVLLDVSDAQGSSASCSTTVTVTQGGVNNPPVASDDTYTATKNTALNIAAPGVLDNDTDADGDTLGTVLENGVTNGSLTLNTDGSFDYTPNTDFTGQDAFSYYAHDGTDLSVTAAMVMITVN